MAKQNMWMVRAGGEGALIQDFQEKNIVGIGWSEIGDLSNIKDHKKIKELLKKAYPHYKDRKINITAGQLSRFRIDLKKDDLVVTYNPEWRVYVVGKIISDYKFNTKLMQKHHIRDVEWFSKLVERDSLSTSTKNTLGAISTLFLINEDAAKEITNLIKNDTQLPVPDPEEQEEQEESLKEDMEAKAHEFIKDKILSLDWEEMQDLVAGILRAMGYKTIVSSRGADRGKDILASPDGLGLEEPRIKVEVKHRAGHIGSPEVRSFTGGLRSGDKGLYVSTGGFSKDARYEGDRSTIPMTLIDSDMLVNLVIQYYDNFDSETKTLLPLTKIYWPA